MRAGKIIRYIAIGLIAILFIAMLVSHFMKIGEYTDSQEEIEEMISNHVIQYNTNAIFGETHGKLIECDFCDEAHELIEDLEQQISELRADFFVSICLNAVFCMMLLGISFAVEKLEDLNDTLCSSQPASPDSESAPEEVFHTDKVWDCACGRTNPEFVSTCACGRSKYDL